MQVCLPARLVFSLFFITDVQKNMLTAPNLNCRTMVSLKNSLQVHILFIYNSILRFKFLYDRHISIMAWTFWDCFLKTQLLVIDLSQYWHKNSVPQNKFLYAAKKNFAAKACPHYFQKKCFFSLVGNIMCFSTAT